MIRLFFIVILLAIVAQRAFAQKQLVLLKREKVLLRLYPGDDFNYRLKGSKTVRRSYVNNLFDTAVMAHRDVIPFHKIDRIYFDQRNFLNVVGGVLVTGGTAYFLIDQVNEVIVHGEKPSLEKRVTTASLSMVGVGLPLMLIHKKSQRIGGRYRLIMADKDSPFYRPDLRKSELIIPYD